MRTQQPDQAVSAFTAARPRLRTIADRILRDPGEAEDVVQEAWLRWHRTDRSVVADPAGFLATTTTRLALNAAQCARRRHEIPAGAWPSDSPDGAAGPELQCERRDAVETVVSLLMARLPPAERAVYVLREGFGYPHRRLAEVLRLRVAHSRQLLRRAHQRLGSTSPSAASTTVDAAARRRLVEAFLAAARTGDVAGLEALLAGGVRTAAGAAPPPARPARPPAP